MRWHHPIVFHVRSRRVRSITQCPYEIRTYVSGCPGAVGMRPAGADGSVPARKPADRKLGRLDLAHGRRSGRRVYSRRDDSSRGRPACRRAHHAGAVRCLGLFRWRRISQSDRRRAHDASRDRARLRRGGHDGHSSKRSGVSDHLCAAPTSLTSRGLALVTTRAERGGISLAACTLCTREALATAASPRPANATSKLESTQRAA